MLELTLSDIDRDGALEDTLGRAAGQTRADLIRRAVIGSAAFAAALALPGRSDAALAARDVDILNYALTLEYLQAAFYTEAERAGALRDRTATAARVVGAVERAHVRAVRKVLGEAAVGRPSFDFQGTTETQDAFLKTAVAFEDLAVAAYKGQAPRITAPAVLAAAISIHSVEARHAAWMRYLFGLVPASRPFDDAFSKQKVLRVVAATRFISTSPKTTAQGEPRLTG